MAPPALPVLPRLFDLSAGSGDGSTQANAHFPFEHRTRSVGQIERAEGVCFHTQGANGNQLAQHTTQLRF